MRTRSNREAVSLAAAVLAVFFFAQCLDGRDATRADEVAATEAQHAVAEVRQQAKVERATRLAAMAP